MCVSAFVNFDLEIFHTNIETSAFLQESARLELSCALILGFSEA